MAECYDIQTVPDVNYDDIVFQRLIAGCRIPDGERKAFRNRKESYLNIEAVKGAISGSKGFLDFYEKDGELFISSLGIEPGNPAGVGEALLETLEYIAQQRGIEKIRTHPDNKEYPFWEYNGYEVEPWNKVFSRAEKHIGFY